MPEYVEDDDSENDNDNDNAEKCIEDINNSMKNATVSDDMKTVTLHFDQPWKTFGLCHVWPQKIEAMLASTTDNCVEQRWVVDMVMIKFHVIDPNNLLFRDV